MAKWFVKNKKADFYAIAERFHIHPVTARLLCNRNLVNEEQIAFFLHGGIEDLYSPHLLKGAERLVEILLRKIDEGASIRIIGDYDIDGVMSTLLLHKALTRCGARISYAIPHRVTDGYGLNQHLIEMAVTDGVDTIITCDNGIAAINEIAYARERGMTVLVTDHHRIPFEEADGEVRYLQSDADAIVNPHQEACGYPYKELCGAAVAWKVVCLLYEARGIPFKEAEDMLEFVAFATVGDIMPLTDENRILVREGLKRMHHTDNVGMQALIARCGLQRGDIDTYHLGYVLGPCINAAGRLDTAKLAMELFTENNPVKALQTADELVALNERRKEETTEGVERARALAESPDYEKDKVLVIYLEDVHESIAGIIAGKIREYYEKPAIILTRAEEGLKGSGRSVEGYSMYEELCKCRDLLTKFGGHPMAAGLSLAEQNAALLRRRLNENCSLKEEDMEEKIHIDIAMPITYPTMELVQEWDILAPFGRENPRPVFADKNLKIRRMFLVGKKQNVLRLQLGNDEGKTVPAVLFKDVEGFFGFLKDKFGEVEVEKARSGRENEIRLSVVYAPKLNTYMGETSLQFEIQFFC